MNTQSSELYIIKASQRAWATRNGLAFDVDGYCGCEDDNIFRRLSPDARIDFEGGDGFELGKDRGRGKFRALHSSSALVCNWFDYWRYRGLQCLAQAFGVSVRFSTLALEQKFSSRLGGIGPDLEVLLTCDSGTHFAIESKFTELYVKSKSKTYLKPKYHHGDRNLWDAAGLPGCQTVAEALRTGRHHFEVLDVAQLLKHMLALATNSHHWSLCYLWFEAPGSLAYQHRRELLDFAAQIATDSAHFSVLTSQELFARMELLVGRNDSEYMEYLRDRYICDPVVPRTSAGNNSGSPNLKVHKLREQGQP